MKGEKVVKLDILGAEIGSTTTVVNGFVLESVPKFIGSGQAPTSVKEGDVNIGLHHAIENLKDNLSCDVLEYKEMVATSSAAGGLKMTVHGLVYDMTVRAAKEAALGAGANLHMVTAGKLRRTDIKKLQEIMPNIILIAGGVDYGERDTAIYNAEKIRELGEELDVDIPVIYAGNLQNQEEMKCIFEGYKGKLYLVENVYPKIDQLNVEPTRKVIQKVFEEHIIHAKGMTKVRELVKGSIMPTPAGVMEATKLIAEELGDVATIDIGGATTDIHSVTEGAKDIGKIMIAPEPRAKRTVEGDLGVYINAGNILKVAKEENIWKQKIKIQNSEKQIKKQIEKQEQEEQIEKFVKNLQPIPKTKEEVAFIKALAKIACDIALDRHAGEIISLYATSGRKYMAQGKDLTALKYIIGTGGALTRLPGGLAIIKEVVVAKKPTKLLPRKDVEILIDKDYIMASLGVISKRYPKESRILLKKSLGIEEEKL